jgi:hypothetical protein
MDGHPPEGFDRPDLPPNTVLRPPEVYDIPLRSLYSRNLSNLWMAGRNISASYVAFTSARVMATCAVEGQAIGTAAALCVQSGLTPRALARDTARVRQLQQTLLRDDQSLKSVRNQDTADLARAAAVTASSEDGPSRAALVLDGHLRDLPDSHGDPAEVHHWAAPTPAWIELKWDRPRRIGLVQVTFDSGFKRQLTLSSQDSQQVNLLRAPQPETVRDYDLVARTSNGKELVLASVKGNFQRLCRHPFSPIDLESLRIVVHATNGDPLARIFEIRCYA